MSPTDTAARDALVTTSQLARILGVTPQAVNKAVRRGDLPVAEESEQGHRYFRLSEVSAALRELRETPS